MKPIITIACVAVALCGAILGFNWIDHRAEPRGSRNPPRAGVDPRTSDPRSSAWTHIGKDAAFPSESEAIPIEDSDARLVASRRLALLNDPVARNARLREIRANYLRMYPGLGNEIDLAERETERFIDVLAEHRLSANIEINTVIASEPSASLRNAQIARLQEEASQRLDDEVREYLGSERYARWQTYQSSLPARTELTATVARMLGEPSTGVIAASQLDSVVSVMLAEERRRATETRQLLQSAGVIDPSSRPRVQEALLSLRESSNRRILDSAATVLSSDQLSKLRVKLQAPIEATRAAQQRSGVHGSN